MAIGLRWPSKDKRDRTAWARAAGPHPGAGMQEFPFESRDQGEHQAWGHCERVLSLYELYRGVEPNDSAGGSTAGGTGLEGDGSGN